MNDAFLEIREVKKAMDTLRYISGDDEVRAIADIQRKTINDYNSQMTVAMETGIALGKEEGIALGKEEGIALGKEEGIAIGEAKGLALIKETARSMLSEGMSPETVSRCTKLSIEEIVALQKLTRL
jgi:predicted transposase YdaD